MTKGILSPYLSVFKAWAMEMGRHPAVLVAFVYSETFTGVKKVKKHVQ